MINAVRHQLFVQVFAFLCYVKNYTMSDFDNPFAVGISVFKEYRSRRESGNIGEGRIR